MRKYLFLLAAAGGFALATPALPAATHPEDAARRSSFGSSWDYYYVLVRVDGHWRTKYRGRCLRTAQSVYDTWRRKGYRAKIR